MNNSGKNSDTLFYFIAWFVIIVSIALRITAFFNNYNIVAPDECHSLSDIENASFIGLFSRYIQGANFLQFYRILFKCLYLFNGFNFTVLKFPALIAGILSIFVFFNILLKLFKHKLIIISALAVFAFNFNLIYYSVQIKPYALDILLFLILINTAFYISNNYKTSTIPNKKLVYYILTSIFITFSSLVNIVNMQIFWGLLFIQNIIQKNIPNIKKYILYEIITVPVILLNYFLYIKQMQTSDGLENQWLTNFYFKPDCLDALNTLVHFSFFNFFWFDKTFTTVLPDKILITYLLLFCAGVLLFIINAVKNSDKYFGLFITTPVLFFLLLSFLNIYPFTNRPILFLIPLFIIIPFKILDNKYLNIFSVVLLIFFFNYLYRLGDLNRYITNIEQSNKFKQSILELNRREPDSIIISTEQVCINCLNNKNIIVIDKNNSKIKSDNIYLTIFNKKDKTFQNDIPLKELLNNKKNVYFAYNDIDDKNDEISIINGYISNLGYKKISEINNDTIIQYSKYIKGAANNEK